MTARLVGFPKPSTFRSEKLRRAVATLPCVNCGKEGATQAAHANQGKGMAIKSSDARIAALCTTCHGSLDQGGKMLKADRRDFEDQMVLLTYIALIERGLLQVVA
jgi:hypothetical protein